MFSLVSLTTKYFDISAGYSGPTERPHKESTMVNDTWAGIFQIWKD